MNRSDVRKILAGMRTSVPAELEKELLEQYESHEIQYTEQDVYEQLRKRLCWYEKKKTAAR